MKSQPPVPPPLPPPFPATGPAKAARAKRPQVNESAFAILAMLGGIAGLSIGFLICDRFGLFEAPAPVSVAASPPVKPLPKSDAPQPATRVMPPQQPSPPIRPEPAPRPSMTRPAPEAAPLGIQLEIQTDAPPVVPVVPGAAPVPAPAARLAPVLSADSQTMIYLSRNGQRSSTQGDPQTQRTLEEWLGAAENSKGHSNRVAACDSLYVIATRAGLTDEEKSSIQRWCRQALRNSDIQESALKLAGAVIDASFREPVLKMATQRPTDNQARTLRRAAMECLRPIVDDSCVFDLARVVYVDEDDTNKRLALELIVKVGSVRAREQLEKAPRSKLSKSLRDEIDQAIDRIR